LNVEVEEREEEGGETGYNLTTDFGIRIKKFCEREMDIY
jgi:hypothetical protein